MIMKAYRVNVYLASLIVTIAGAAAAFVIIRVVYSDVSALMGGSEARYADLEHSILTSP